MIDQYKISLNCKQMNTVQIKVYGEGRGLRPLPLYTTVTVVVVMFKYIKFLKLYQM